jgi:type I restriction-modification system DNA methylase subunit
MSEELIQRGLDRKNPTSKIGKWDYFSIGATTLKALKTANIIRNVDYGLLESKKVDGIIINNKDVIAVVEFKQPKEFKTKKQKDKAIAQEIEVAKILGCKIIIATDTVDTLWVNALTNEKICDESGVEIKVAFNPLDEHLASLVEKINYSINEKNNNILPKQLVNPTDLAKSIWQDIWSVSGATPENCLYTFVELFIFKYLSDLGILKNRHSFEFLIAMQTTDSSDEILQYYADEIRKKIKELFPYNPLDNTTIINGTIFVSKDQKSVSGYSTVFIKVLKKFADYGRLEHIDYDFKSQLFESFLKESISKKNWGQFFTPMKVIRAIEKIAKDEIKEGAVICDPACGVGKFLLEPIKSKLSQFYKVEGDSVIPKITIRGFDKGFDKDEQKTIILAKANMLIYFSEIIKDFPNHTVEFGKIFNDSFTLKTNSILGTLRDPIENEYDLILTNPPYVTSGSSNLKEEISKDSELKKYYKINAIGVEGLFMEWIIRALKPNGKAFIVIPDGIFNRQNDKNLREFIKQECFIDGIISLPLNTFFTTNKKTYILCITKKNNKADTQTDPVFTYLVSEIGESRDIYRFNVEQNDLNEATTLYNFFKGNKSSFESFNTDPRCKIFRIDEFSSETHWIIDRWWSKEEKIALGIEEEDKAVSMLDFSSLVQDMSDTLSSLSAEIKDSAVKKKSNLEQNFKELKIKDIFDLSQKTNSSKFTKTFIEQNSGNIPVYSASDNEKLVGYGYVKDNLPNIRYFENCMIWNIDGSIGQVFMRKGRFSLSEKVIPLIPFDEYKDKLNDLFLKIIIENQAIQENFGFTNKAGKDKLGNLVLKIPILSNGDFDIKAQEEIIEKYNLINDLKSKIVEYKQTIKNLQVKIDIELENFKEVKIKEIFETKKGLSKYTKSYGQANKGEYPVYSASNIAPLTHINSYDYDGKYLTWATNGFAGYIKVIYEKFSANGDRGILIPKFNELDLDYVKFLLEPILRRLAKGRKGDNGKDEFTKVYPSMVENVTIKLPILKNENYDLETQKEIAKKYLMIEQIKASIEEELNKIEKLMVDFQCKP